MALSNNLTVSIGADSSKMRADLALAQARLKEFGREVRLAAEEARKTGDRTNLDRLSRQYEALTRSAKGLQTQLRATNHELASPAWSVAAKGAAALHQEFLNLAKSGLGFAGGIGGALLGAVNLLGRTKDQLLELRRLSQSTGFSPGALKAVDETLEDIGQEAGAGSRALVKLSQAFAQARQEARAAGETIGSAVAVLRGTDAKDKPDQFGVDVSRGGKRNVQQIKDQADALDVLGVKMSKFKDDAAGNDAALQAIIDGFTRLARQGRIDEGNLAGMVLLGKGMREALPALKALGQEAGGLQRKMDELRGQGRFPDEAAMQRALDYQKGLKDVGDSVDSVGFSLLKTFGPGAQEQMKLFTNDINAISRAATDIGNLWHLLTDRMVRDVQEALPQIGQAFTDMFARLTSGFVELGNAIAGWARNVAAAVRSVLPGGSLSGPATAAPIEIPPMASGGFIRGAGSGTSDSILARLSNGEFVMRASAVQHWGAGLLSAMNAAGAPRFAAGGMVAAGGGGTPVHLHLGGNSFALSGNQGVVSALVTEAHRHKMRAAGVKPSWYGGTPGR